jgi:thiamine-phosphate pyrophosphorylase
MSRLPPAPFLYPIVDLALLGDRPLGAFVRELARAGARLVQIRAKEGSDRLFVAAAREARAAAAQGGAVLVVNDRPDIARIVGAQGVHLGQDDLDPRDVRAFLGEDALIGYSTHTLAQVQAAPQDALDYLALGPVFETRTKARPDPVVGIPRVREVLGILERPLVAIGGLGLGNVADVAAAGASGLALASAFFGPEGPGEAFRTLEAALRGPSRG